jgi:CBS domain-containing protein
MLLVRDVMTAGVFTLAADTAAEEAAWALTNHAVSGAPVVDGDGNVIGMLSKSDLVNPAPRDWIAGEATAEDLMTPKIHALYAEDPALAAAELMARQHIHRVLVLDEDGRPVGMVSSMDIVKAVAGGAAFAVG